MKKRKTYEKIPEFDQTTHMVIQLPPTEKNGEMYCGVKVVELPESKEEFEGV